MRVDNEHTTNQSATSPMKSVEGSPPAPAASTAAAASTSSSSFSTFRMFRRWVPEWLSFSHAPNDAAVDPNPSATGGDSSTPDTADPIASKRTTKAAGALPKVKKRLHLSFKKPRQNAGKNSGASDDSEGVEEISGERCSFDPEDLAKQGLELTHFTEENKTTLRTTWHILYSKMGHDLYYVGIRPKGGIAETFFRLFEEFPKSQEFFTKFRDAPVEALRADVRLYSALQEHALRVMQVVEKVIGRLDQQEKSTKYLLELGKFHRLSGIPNDYFGVMGTIFVHAVRPYWEEAGCMSEETEDAWMMLFAHIARVMTHGHKYLHLQHLVPLQR